ncbi:uncharacterized protein [Eleutherodactylus coqui]|uniref:uncharacterized protein isoform X3 n=1 Tax=Eleutherodactylus coqui TaxID=57060 RepID=UPI003462BB42
MKSIAIFMLVGLSLFSNGLCSEEAADPSCKCMTAAFKGKTDLLNSAINVVCDYDEMEPGAEANTQLIGTVSGKLQTILKPTGCLTKAIDDLESGVGITAKVVSSLDSLGLVSSVRIVVCRVLRRVPVVQCVENLLDVDKTVKGVTNLVGSILNPLTELKCASLNPESTLDQIIKPLDQLCPGLGQTLITVKQDIMKLPAELQKRAEKSSVGALVGERQDSLSPAPNRLVGAVGNVVDSLSLALSGLVGTFGGIPENVIQELNGLASAEVGGGGLLAVVAGL